MLGFFLVESAIAQGTDKYWIDVDYLLWKIKENPVPAALVTKADFSDALPGAIGQPHTRVVLGKKSVDMEWMQGFELGAGVWIKQNLGLQASYFLLPAVSKSKHLKTSGQPGSANYAVPIFDVTGVFGLNGVPGETIFILPGPDENEPGFFGDFTLQLKSELQGAELNTFYRSLRREHFVLDWIFGVRWIDLHEELLFKAKTHAASGFSFGNAFFCRINKNARKTPQINPFQFGTLEISDSMIKIETVDESNCSLQFHENTKNKPRVYGPWLSHAVLKRILMRDDSRSVFD
jgi:hypothetical protein